MGLFSETKTYVSSSVLNMGEGSTDRATNLMATMAVSAVLSGNTQDWSANIRGSLNGSTAMRQRRFFAWAQQSYALGMPEANITGSMQIDLAQLQAPMRDTLRLASTQDLQIISARVDAPDVSYWAEEWLLENHPDLVDGDWTADVDLGTNEATIDVSGRAQMRFPMPADLLWGVTGQGRKLLFSAYRVMSRKGKNKLKEAGPTKLFVYRMGTGDAVLDALAPAEGMMGEFYPALPLRLENKSIRAAEHADKFEAVDKAFDKMFKQDVNEILDQIEENEDIAEVDFCFLVPSVTLESKNQVVREYLYRFFKEAAQFQQTDALQTYLASSEGAVTYDVAWSRWLKANTGAAPRMKHPLYDTPAPVSFTGGGVQPSRTDLRFHMPQLPNLDLNLSWISIEETQHVGNAKHFDGDQARSKLKRGRYWVTSDNKGPAPELSAYVDLPTTERVMLFHQHGRRHYSKIVVTGLQHTNHIYKGRKVEMSGHDAISDKDVTGFLIPLHAPTVRALGITKANQLTLNSSHLLFNHYKQVKLKWYETKLFRFALIVGAVALSIATAGGSLAAAGGILGTNAAVGAAVGASAATAAFVGAAVNAIAGVILSTLITKASVSLFGEKWGAVIGTIASFIAMSYGTQYATHGNFAVDWGQMMKAENLMGVTQSVSEAYTRWIAADTAELYDDMGQLKEEYAEQSDEIEALSNEILGMTGQPFDPMLLTDAAEHFGERRETFLSRTLMTGSDIAELSMAMIEDFATASLELPQALR